MDLLSCSTAIQAAPLRHFFQPLQMNMPAMLLPGPVWLALSRLFRADTSENVQNVRPTFDILHLDFHNIEKRQAIQKRNILQKNESNI
ncbi:hypothetical protein C7R93_23280 [Brevibacillus fortis]|uniref:Uncharacterized protein n=1 Tax=Brevibacillus fortis TaxID=2126352 RepID=A0A2P7UR56_9BACL|nr:hypothetical protein C7R93_23280 [Brevibacillus fortis]